MKQKNILVVGSINMDMVLKMKRMALSGESMLGESYSYVPGGKGANASVGAARLGANVTFVGCVGDDANGKVLLDALKHEGINCEYTKISNSYNTGLAVIILETNGDNRIVVYPSANHDIDKKTIDAVFADNSFDKVMMQLEIKDEIIYHTAELAYKNGVKLVLDAGPARDFDISLLKNKIHVLSPNETEIKALTGMDTENNKDLIKACKKLYNITNAKHIVVKLGKRGCFYYNNHTNFSLPSYKVEAIDTTAAGDAFTGALCYAIDDDITKENLNFAQAAGALAVTVLGAQPSMHTYKEVIEFIKNNDKIVNI